MNDLIQFIREKCMTANPSKKWGNSYWGDENAVPCRLVDVLLAMGERAKDFELRGEYLWSWNIDVPKYNDDRANQIFWNLRADDLEKQSEETINFLYDLLK